MKVFQLKEITNILARTPNILDELLGDLPESLIHCTEGEGTWSPFAIVGHLIHGEKTDWLTRAKIILSNNADKKFARFDREAMFAESKRKTLADLLGEFRMSREDNLQKLEAMQITEEKLAMTGIHPVFGEVTLAQLLATWAVHDLDHLAQIERVIAKQFKLAVGPWKKYLRIVSE